MCMEPVAVLGHHCAAHTWAVLVVPPRIVRIREAIPDERRCTGIKRDGERCNFKRIIGTERCRVHGEVQHERVCTATLHSGVACTRRAGADGLCAMHFRSEEARLRKVNLAEWSLYDTAEIDRLRREARREHRGLLRNFDPDGDLGPNRDVGGRLRALHFNSLMQGFLRQRPEPLPAEEMRPLRAAMRVDLALRSVIEFNRLRELVWTPVLPAEPLARFANDMQNVHTPEATRIVEAADGLTVVARDNVLKEIVDCWTARQFGTMKQRIAVRIDMEHWYNAPLVRVHNDFAYKIMLNRIWSVVATSKYREDMEKCLWAEVLDSIGMCAQGHMTRLANAIQGFDTNEVLEVPRSERLQTAMSQISELPPLERESAARRIFAELDIEESAQGAWLEALA